MSELSDLLFSTPSIAIAFSPEAHVRGMLAFEAALARAEARVGIIPQEAASVITAACRNEPFDVTMLYRAENHLPRGVPFLGEKYLPHQPAQLLLGESTRIPSQASLVGMRSFPRRLGTEGV